MPETNQSPLPTNPKASQGAKKINLFLCPPVALFHMAHAHMDGEIKYGPYKFRETRVEASVYVAAAIRHLEQWADGEECASDSGCHHLGHVMACMAILLDAQAYGNLIDDRAKTGVLSSVIESILEKIRKKTNAPSAKQV